MDTPLRYKTRRYYTCMGKEVKAIDVSDQDGTKLAQFHNQADFELFMKAKQSMPDLLEAYELLKMKVNPFTNNQATHDRVVALINKLG